LRILRVCAADAEALTARVDYRYPSALGIARYTAAIVLLLIISISLRFVVPKDLDSMASAVMLVYIGVFCLLLPPRIGLPCFFGVLGVICALKWVNEEKIALTQLPLTGLDIKIALAHPTGLLGAIGAPLWLNSAILPAAYIFTLLIVLGISASIFYLWKHFRSTTVFEFMIVGLLFVICLSQSKQFVSTYVPDLQARRQTDLYKPQGFAKLSRDIGTLPFLALSMYLENETDRKSVV